MASMSSGDSMSTVCRQPEREIFRKWMIWGTTLPGPASWQRLREIGQARLELVAADAQERPALGLVHRHGLDDDEPAPPLA